MPNSKQIVYLSQAQYQELITNQSITVNGVTVTYDENDIYVTPQAEPVTDVRINGTSIAANGIANIPTAIIASGEIQSNLGLVKVRDGYDGLRLNNSGSDPGRLSLYPTSSAQIKAGNDGYLAVTTMRQHEATFYGLAKAAGTDLASAQNITVGTYTPEAKGAIQTMLGIDSLIAPKESDLVADQAYTVGDVFMMDGKLYKVTAAIAQDGAITVGTNCVETDISENFVHDVQVNGTSVVQNGTANIPVVSAQNVLGLVKVHTDYGLNVYPSGLLAVQGASDNSIKEGANNARPISCANQHKATFYGLAKAAGDSTQSASSNAVGTYTDTAKSAIRTMIGAASSNVIAVQDTQPTDTDTKIWLPETAETPVEVPTVAEMNAALAGKVGDVQVNGTSVVNSGVANIPLSGQGQLGVVQFNSLYGISHAGNGFMSINKADDNMCKVGSDTNRPIVPSNQHRSVFYGLAKAAGDSTQSASDNAVGTYTDDAKAAIRTMLGAVGSEDYATANDYGLVKVNSSYGITKNSNTDALQIVGATAAQCKSRTGSTGYQPLTVFTEDASAFYGLAYAAGDTTMASSSNAVGTYTDSAKASIKAMLGIVDGSTGTVTVTGTTPTITAVENTRYVCGEVATLSITPPASGICIIRFTSGTTATVLTATGVVWPEWFDVTALEASRVYEICITDGYGAVMSWAL